MSMRPQIPVRSSESEQALQFIRQMGIENVSLMLGPDELTAEAIRAQKNKLAALRPAHLRCRLHGTAEKQEHPPGPARPGSRD